MLYYFVSGGLSTPGRRDGVSEDCSMQVIPSDFAMLTTKGALFVVSDGMGGHNAGQVASQVATQTLVDAYYRDARNDLPGSLERAIQTANSVVWNQSLRVPQYRGMGTTLVALVIRGSQVFIASVGDSRVYLARSGRLWQVTRDHSYMDDLISTVHLSPAQARRHPFGKLLKRALGRSGAVQVDLFQGNLSADDVFLLCTDGLSDWVHNREIRDSLARQRDAARAVGALVTLAYRRGSDDNITGLVVRLAPARNAVVPAIASRTTIRIARPAGTVPRSRPVVAGQANQLAWLTLALGGGLIMWAIYFALLIGRLHGS